MTIAANRMYCHYDDYYFVDGFKRLFRVNFTYDRDNVPVRLTLLQHLTDDDLEFQLQTLIDCFDPSHFQMV